jgi:hypothetical protein
MIFTVRHRPQGLILMMAFCLLTALAPRLSMAGVSYDFEQPYFVEEIDLQCKDHALVKENGVYHVFYIHSFPPEQGDYLRSERWLGHLTSTDLRHWARQDSILPVSETPPGGWEGKFIWAPKVITNPENGSWFLYYTGVDQSVVQQTGMAYSWDLYDWTRWPFNPIYHPGPWAAWAPGTWSNCRDPEIFHDSLADEYLMLNTATAAGGNGAISLGTSNDLVTWMDQGAFFENDSEAVLESAQLLESDGLYHLFFTEQWVQGTSHVSSPTLYGPWTKDGLSIIDVGNAPEISDLGGEIVFSRHNAVGTIDGPRYYYRFDHIDLDGPGGVPQIQPLDDGLGSSWSVLFGSAFDNQPTWGDNPHFRGETPSNMEGNAYLATYEDFHQPIDGLAGTSQGHLPVGLLRSEIFTLTDDRMRLMVGGGDDMVHIFVGLVRAVDETLFFLETGTGDHDMDLRLWDTSALAGEEVYLVVADLSFSAGGFVSVDGILEYPYGGSDPVTPSLPMLPGPLLDDILSDAGYDLTGVGGETDNSPQAIAGRLLDPQPNPFNPRSHLRYELHEQGRATMTIHDARGRLMRTLLDETLPAGPGFVIWNGRDEAGLSAPSGVYFARLTLDGAPLGRKKLTLLR